MFDRNIDTILLKSVRNQNWTESWLFFNGWWSYLLTGECCTPSTSMKLISNARCRHCVAAGRGRTFAARSIHLQWRHVVGMFVSIVIAVLCIPTTVIDGRDCSDDVTAAIECGRLNSAIEWSLSDQHWAISVAHLSMIVQHRHLVVMGPDDGRDRK